MAGGKPLLWQPGQSGASTRDVKLRAPATERNREVILAGLRAVLPASGLVLEIASGSGEHILHFARAFPALTFQPSDPDADARASIAAWSAESGLCNILPPLALDAAAAIWPAVRPQAILCINMIHIAPLDATEGLFRQAGALLGPGAPLHLYGPFKRPGQPLEPSNAAFDASLRQRDPRWGLRDLDDVSTLAAQAGFGLPEIQPMPANNLSLVYRKH